MGSFCFWTNLGTWALDAIAIGISIAALRRSRVRKPFSAGLEGDAATRMRYRAHGVRAIATQCDPCDLWWAPWIHGPMLGEACPKCGAPVVPFRSRS